MSLSLSIPPSQTKITRILSDYVAYAWRDCFSIVTVDNNNPGDTEQFSLFENSSNGEGSAIQVEEKIL